MSVSFILLKANGQRFDPLPGHDNREFSLSNANAADVLHALGIEDSFTRSADRAPQDQSRCGVRERRHKRPSRGERMISP